MGMPAMTARQFLDRRVRRVRLLTVSGLIVAIGSLLVLSILKAALSVLPPFAFPILIAAIIGGIALIIAGRYALSTVRCPWCRGELGLLIVRLSSFDQLRFCPKCGESLDDVLAAEGKPKKNSMKKATSWEDELA